MLGRLTFCVVFFPHHKAPVERRIAVGNVIRREEDIPFTFGFGGMGTVTVPKLIANALNLHTPQEGRFALDHDIELDDNCYTGKDGNYDECVDFDPPHQYL
jgi:hypothetical protein